MAEKMTQKQALAIAIEALEGTEHTEAVEVLTKMLEQKSKPRQHKVKPEVEMFREAVLAMLQEATGPMTNKEVAEAMEVSSQKASAALRFLVKEELVVRTEGEKKSEPTTFVAA